MIPSGHPAWGETRRALLVALAAAGTLIVLGLLNTQDHAVREHSPWQDDPYDVLVSFTLPFVPLMVAVGLVRIALCRADRPLPTARLLGVLRTIDVLLTAVVATIFVSWIAVMTRTHGTDWGSVGNVLILALGVVTLLGIFAGIMAVRAHIQVRRVVAGAVTDPDWVEDLLELFGRGIKNLGPSRPAAERLLGMSRDHVLEGRWGLRRHRAIGALMVAACFGLLVPGSQVLREGTTGESVAQVLAFSALLAVIGTAGMLALLVAAGGYLNLVRAHSGPRAARSPRHRAHGMVAAAASVPVTVAYADRLHWLTRPILTDQPVAQFALLICMIAVCSGVTAFGMSRVAACLRER